MRRSDGVRLLVLLAVLLTSAAAQVLSSTEINEAVPHSLQEKYSSTLQAAAEEIAGHHFPYHFYFSRVLDLPESRQQQTDQRSVRFAKLNDKMALEMTGNYYASYSAAAMDGNARARRTFFDVMLPLLQAVVPRFPADQDFDAFALEVSHHVRGKVMGGVSTENAENLVVILPRAAAKKLVSSASLEPRQAAILEGTVLLDGNPIQLWLADDRPPADWNKRVKQRAVEPQVIAVASSSPAATAVSDNLIKPPAMPVRLIAPDTLHNLQSSHQDVIARMVKELEPQVHFVSYAPPAFIAFHQGAYLQLSMTTSVNEPAATRYAAAALAFDEHISHLVRPVMAYFQDDSSFDGIDFSTTVKGKGSESPVSVEFLVPFATMRCYAQYDCTGQQLIAASIVLINGERAGLDLQNAEATSPK